MELLNAPLPDTGYSAFQRYMRGPGQLIDVPLIQNREFVPSIVGEQQSVYEFPIRTAVCETNSYANEPSKVLSNINIGFSINTETNRAAPEPLRDQPEMVGGAGPAGREPDCGFLQGDSAADEAQGGPVRRYSGRYPRGVVCPAEL